MAITIAPPPLCTIDFLMGSVASYLRNYGDPKDRQQISSSSIKMKLLPHRFAEVFSTHRHITLVTPDLDLRAFFDCVPLLIGAEVHRGLAAIDLARRWNQDGLLSDTGLGAVLD
ncbi:hypothetical protein OAE39_02520 [Akkermansiaceae bacterium]|nr:hypothetical protein [Akkermansiaceae bacterium]